MKTLINSTILIDSVRLILTSKLLFGCTKLA